MADLSVSMVFAAGTLPPPSDQNSDSSESNSASDALSPFFAHSKNRAIRLVESGEFAANFGADCTACPRALCGFSARVFRLVQKCRDFPVRVFEDFAEKIDCPFLGRQAFDKQTGTTWSGFRKR